MTATAKADEGRTVLVDPSCVDAARKAMGKLIRKAQRYGAAEIRVEEAPHIHITHEEIRGTQLKITVKRECVAMTVFGLAPRVGTYTFIARIEHTKAGNIVDCVPGETADASWFERAGTCDHCGKKRNRNFVFAVRDASGKVMIVGRQCLRDYLGIDDPKAILARFDMLRSLEVGGGDDDWSWGGGRGERSASTLIVLAYAAAIIRMDGWVSKAAAAAYQEKVDASESGKGGIMTTAGNVGFAMAPCPNLRDGHEIVEAWKRFQNVTEADVAMAEAARAWAIASTETSDYARNLRVLNASDTVALRRIGFVVSTVASYQRAMDTLAKRERAEQTPKVDALSGRHTVDATIKSVRREMTDFGETLKALYVITTPNGEWRAWGTVPAAVRELEHDGVDLRGKRINLTATFAPKADDKSFAFASRPHGALVEGA